MAKVKKEKGTELRVTVMRPLKETKNQREVPSKETQVGPSGKMELRLWPKRSVLGWSVGWRFGFGSLSLVSPVRSSVVGVAPWSAFKPGSLSLVPSDHGDGDVKLGAGKGAYDLPSSAAVGSPALLLCDACQCLGSLAMTWLLGFWVVVSSGSHKKIVGCFRSLGCFLDWFFPQGPVYEFPIWSARIVKQRWVKGIRKGWKRRLHERCRALHTLSPCVRFGQPSKDEKGAGKQNQSKGGAKGKKSAEVISKESDWTLVGRKGKPQPPSSFSNGKSEFRLRESDWQGYTIVPRVQKLGAILDSDKKSDPLVILVFTSQELVNLLQMIQGEKGIRITVLCPCKKGDTITVDGFPNIHFEEKRYPVQDNAGKVLTKIMACWTNGVAFNQHIENCGATG